MTARTPAQLALDAAGCLSALADTLLSYSSGDNHVFVCCRAILPHDRVAASLALAQWLRTVPAAEIDEPLPMTDSIRRVTLEIGGPTRETLCAWADALREWAREHGEAQRCTDPECHDHPNREPSREDRIDAAVCGLLPWNWSGNPLWIDTGNDEGFAAHPHEICGALYRMAAALVDDHWTLPQPASRVTVPDPGATPSAPSEPTVGYMIAHSIWNGPTFSANDGIPHFADRIDAAIAKAVQNERLDRHESEARLIRAHAAHIAALGEELRRLEKQRSNAVAELDALRAKIRTLISGAK